MSPAITYPVATLQGPICRELPRYRGIYTTHWARLCTHGVTAIRIRLPLITAPSIIPAPVLKFEASSESQNDKVKNTTTSRCSIHRLGAQSWLRQTPTENTGQPVSCKSVLVRLFVSPGWLVRLVPWIHTCTDATHENVYIRES